MVLIMRADSTEFATATITADHDISAATVEVALPPANVAPMTWYSATKLGTVQVGTKWTCTYRILLGPASGVTTLSAGSYDWTVRLTDTPGPEVPVRKAGSVMVTAT